MISLYLVVAFSSLVVFCLALLFRWAVRTGQWDDLDTPAHRILTEDLDEHRK